MVLDRDEYFDDCFSEELTFVPHSVTSKWEIAPKKLPALLKPLLFRVFTLPGEGAEEGSREWRRSLVARNLFPIKYLVKYPKLMISFLKRMIGSLTKEGVLPLFPGEKVPDSSYVRKKGYSYATTAKHSNSYAFHQDLYFLRKINVQRAIWKLRDVGCFPFKTDPDTMPADMAPVNNYAHVKFLFWVWYCYFEGL